MSDNSTASLVQLLMETGAFIVILGVGVARLREGPWAVLTALGGLLAGISVTVTLLLFVEITYTSSSTLWDFFVRNSSWLDDALRWSRAIGLGLLAVALVVRFREPRVNPLNG